METMQPELRFPEFSGEWEEMRLGNLVNIKSGQSPSSYSLNDFGKNPFVKVEELNNCNKYQINSRFYSDDTKNLIQVNSIIFPKRGAAILNNKIRINSVPILMDSNMMALVPIQKLINNEYLFYTINKVELFKIADTSTIPQINNKHIEPYLLIVPKIQEQTRIATFLTAVDKKLTALKQKKNLLEQYKKGVMQQLFSQELRFKDGNGKDFANWEEKKLGEVTIEVKRDLKDKSDLTNLEVLTISSLKGFITQKERFSQVIAGDSLVKYTLLQKGEMSYNRGASKSFQFGCFHSLKQYEKALVPNVYISFSFNNNCCNEFYLQLFSTGFANNQLRKFISSSVRLDGLLNINRGDFFSIKIPVPMIEEQTKIASFLSSLNEKINHCQLQITQTEQYKKGLLQNMFV